MVKGTLGRFSAKIICVLIGIVFIVIGTIVAVTANPKAYDKETTGIIVHIDEHWETHVDEDDLVHDVYIDYTVDGKTYTNVQYPEYKAGMQVGDEVKVYYQSENPLLIAGEGKDLLPVFGIGFAVIGLIMIAVSVISFLKGR